MNRPGLLVVIGKMLLFGATIIAAYQSGYDRGVREAVERLTR